MKNIDFQSVSLNYEFEISNNEVIITKYLGSSQDVIIPEKIESHLVTAIGKSAFITKQLTSVIIPENVEVIGDSSFVATQLKSVIIPNSTLFIGHLAFVHNELTSVTIPKNVKTIGMRAFSENPLTSVIIEGDETRFNDEWTVIGFPEELKPES